MTHDSPITMKAHEVLALLRQVRSEPGGKTVTRRMPTKQWDALERRALAGEPLRLWVRETWGAPDADHPRVVDGRKPKLGDRLVFAANPADAWQWQTGHPGCADFYWRPSIHMPRWASRLTLLDVTIRRERLGDISEENARDEGLIPMACWDCDGDPRLDGQRYDYTGWHWDWSMCSEPNDGHQSARHAYMALWNHLHGPGSWDRDADKEVMVIGFRPVLGNIDKIGGEP